jgi:hypothetical protein
MAKYAKRKKKGTHKRRHHRMGGLSLKMTATNPIVKYGSIVAGYLLADKINPQIDTLTGGKVDTKIVAAGEAGIGAFLTFGPGKKSVVKTAAGGFLLGLGIKRGMTAFGIGNALGGYGQIPVIGGYGQIPVIGNVRRMGAYAPNSSIGVYSPNGSLGSQMNVMNGIGSANDGNGSGLNR